MRPGSAKRGRHYGHFAATHEEIARELGITRQGVCFLEKQALKKLAKSAVTLRDLHDEQQRMADERLRVRGGAR